MHCSWLQLLTCIVIMQQRWTWSHLLGRTAVCGGCFCMGHHAGEPTEQERADAQHDCTVQLHIASLELQGLQQEVTVALLSLSCRAAASALCSMLDAGTTETPSAPNCGTGTWCGCLDILTWAQGTTC